MTSCFQREESVSEFRAQGGVGDAGFGALGRAISWLQVVPALGSELQDPVCCRLTSPTGTASTVGLKR